MDGQTDRRTDTMQCLINFNETAFIVVHVAVAVAMLQMLLQLGLINAMPFL